MHLAAALGKPAMAVFGGGTWPRFVPAVEPSCSMMVGVPCTGCGWVCGFKRPHCIDDVPVEQVKQARGRSGGWTNQRAGNAQVIPAGSALQDQMIREAAEIVRQQQRETGELIRQLHESGAGDRARASAEQARLAAEAAAMARAIEKRVGELEVRHAQELSHLSAGLSARFAAALEADRASRAQDFDQLATRLGQIEEPRTATATEGTLENPPRPSGLPAKTITSRCSGFGRCPRSR